MTTTEEPQVDTQPSISPRDVFRRVTEAAAAPPTEPAQKAAAPAKSDSTPESTNGSAKRTFPEALITGKSKEPEASPTPDPWDAEPPKDLSQKASVHFKKQSEAAKNAITSLKSELTQARAELEGLKKQPGAPSQQDLAEMATLREQIKTLNGELERTAYERSDTFKQKFSPKEKALREQAGKVLKDAGVSDDMLDVILNTSGTKREDLIADIEMSDSKRHYLWAALVQYDGLQSEKNEELAHASERLKAQEAEYRERQMAEQQQRRQFEEGVFDQVAKRITETFEPFKKIEGDEQWNKEVEQRLKDAREFYSGDAGDMEKLAELTMYGLGAKVIHEMMQATQEKLHEVMAENDRLRSASPSAPSGVSNGRNGASSDDNVPFTEAARRAFHRAQTQ